MAKSTYPPCQNLTRKIEGASKYSMKFGKARPINAITHESNDFAMSPHGWGWSEGADVQDCFGCSQPLQLLHGAQLPCPQLLSHHSRSWIGRDPKALYGSFYVTAAICEHLVSVTGKLSPAKPPWHVTSHLLFIQAHQTGGYKVLLRLCFSPQSLRQQKFNVLNRSTFMLSVISIRDQCLGCWHSN